MISSILTLSDTVALMTSDNYKDRFIAEYIQTQIRYEKLNNLCTRIEAAQTATYTDPAHRPIIEEPTYTCPRETLEDQLSIMRMYLHDLEVRAVMEKIDLNSAISTMISNVILGMAGIGPDAPVKPLKGTKK